ncbi:MAG: DUF72 domain-containing protein, partial [Acidobacteria bacterium]|nr:DUF72 domain-containing protein [Acidobacteriota bacterium]NIO59638.1 DUF72 domain-containing protein [Acidobacteriota bacterium]NIQ30737.1 DUF72 domain-containing protein [Acidobacteriota bacterium]
RALLELLPGPWPTALEFRHDSWFDDDVFELLRLHDAALCVTDAEEGEVPITSTASFGYLRLRRPRYEEQELRIWRDRIVAQA